MDKNEIRQWRMREGTNPPSVPKTSAAAETGFVSTEELDDLYALTVLTAEENNWSAPTREEFEAQYKKEIAMRDNRETGNG